MLQARLKSDEVKEQRRVWGMQYRQHVLETFQLARHNQQQRQALYIGVLRRQALAMDPDAEDASVHSGFSLGSSALSGGHSSRRASLLSVASGVLGGLGIKSIPESRPAITMPASASPGTLRSAFGQSPTSSLTSQQPLARHLSDGGATPSPPQTPTAARSASGNLGTLLSRDVARGEAAAAQQPWADLTRKSMMLSELHAG